MAKKFSKAQKAAFVQQVRTMKEPKPRKKVPRSTRVPNADGAGGALP